MNSVSQKEDTEKSAMDAWLRMQAQNPTPQFIATGVPIRDVRSQPPMPKDIDQAISWGMVFN